MSRPEKKVAKKPARSSTAKSVKTEQWTLRLYVAGQTPRSLTAVANLKRICETHLTSSYRIEVIDLLENPKRASQDGILAIPTLVRSLPEPVRKIIGDLSAIDRVLIGLDIHKRSGLSNAAQSI